MMAYIGFAVVIIFAVLMLIISYSMIKTNVDYPGADFMDWLICATLLTAGCAILYIAYHFAPFCDLAQEVACG